MPGATPAGSLGGTGFSRCQQQAPVVGRFVFQLSLVLGLSPRTWLGCGSRFSQCFLGLRQAGLQPARVRMHPRGAHTSRGRPRVLRAEGKEDGHEHHSRASALASGCLPRRAQSERLLFLGASTYQ